MNSFFPELTKPPKHPSPPTWILPPHQHGAEFAVAVWDAARYIAHGHLMAVHALVPVLRPVVTMFGTLLGPYWGLILPYWGYGGMVWGWFGDGLGWFGDGLG